MHIGGVLDSNTPPPQPASPGLWRLTAAANLAGLSAYLFEQGSLRGEIPVRVEYIGPQRMRFVRADELMAWLRSKPV